VCGAVAYLHQLDIVHRDLKPGRGGEREGEGGRERSRFLTKSFSSLSLSPLSLSLSHTHTLSSENLLLRSRSNDYDVMLADFGLSRYFGESMIMKTTCGTPTYIAPEILQSEKGYGPEVSSPIISLSLSLSLSLSVCLSVSPHIHTLCSLFLSYYLLAFLFDSLSLYLYTGGYVGHWRHYLPSPLWISALSSG
jgi:serine/threonine protein kinase